MCLASDPAQNPYWKRDVRRAYPQLSVITQTELSSLLLQHPQKEVYVYINVTPSSVTEDRHLMPSSISAPPDSKGEDSSPVPVAPREVLELSAAISTITSAQKVYTESKLPPTPPTPFKRWVPELAPDAPHDPNAYFPMVLYK